jgi:hypothetical protein
MAILPYLSREAFLYLIWESIQKELHHFFPSLPPKRLSPHDFLNTKKPYVKGKKIRRAKKKYLHD